MQNSLTVKQRLVCIVEKSASSTSMVISVRIIEEEGTNQK
jgi:hypothetical protein